MEAPDSPPCPGSLGRPLESAARVKARSTSPVLRLAGAAGAAAVVLAVFAASDRPAVFQSMGWPTVPAPVAAVRVPAAGELPSSRRPAQLDLEESVRASAAPAVSPASLSGAERALEPVRAPVFPALPPLARDVSSLSGGAWSFSAPEAPAAGPAPKPGAPRHAPAGSQTARTARSFPSLARTAGAALPGSGGRAQYQAPAPSGAAAQPALLPAGEAAGLDAGPGPAEPARGPLQIIEGRRPARPVLRPLPFGGGADRLPYPVAELGQLPPQAQGMLDALPEGSVLRGVAARLLTMGLRNDREGGLREVASHCGVLYACMPGRGVDFSLALPTGERVAYSYHPAGAWGTHDRFLVTTPRGGQMSFSVSPLALDLSGAGLRARARRVAYDLDGAGRALSAHDLASGAALLVFDRDGDGVAGADGRELLGTATDLDGDGRPDGYRDGFQALDALVARAAARGVISARAASSGRLGPAELAALGRRFGLRLRVGGLLGRDVSFAQAGVRALRLSRAPARLSRGCDGYGDSVSRRAGAVFERADGRLGSYEDFWFAAGLSFGRPPAAAPARQRLEAVWPGRPLPLP